MPVAAALVIIMLVCAPMTPISAAAAAATETNRVGSDQGLTLENIGRGIKSAAKNIEEEIPKIGPAIGDTFKKMTGSDKEKDPPKSSTQNSGKSKK